MPFHPFLGEGSPAKIQYGKKGTRILTSLLEDLVNLTHKLFTFRGSENGPPENSTFARAAWPQAHGLRVTHRQGMIRGSFLFFFTDILDQLGAHPFLVGRVPLLKSTTEKRVPLF